MERAKHVALPTSCEEAFPILAGLDRKCETASGEIAGLSVQKVTLDYSTSGMRFEHWVASALNFRELRTIVYAKGALRAAVETDGIQIGEPDNPVDWVPTGYIPTTTINEFSHLMESARLKAGRN